MSRPMRRGGGGGAKALPNCRRGWQNFARALANGRRADLNQAKEGETDDMGCDPILPAERVEAMVARGLWRGRLITDYLDEIVAHHPKRLALVAANGTAGDSVRLTYGALGRLADRLAVGLAGLGVGPGDVVSLQLPNWWQFTVLHLACVRLGAVTNPLMPIFREREFAFMLDLAESKVVVVPGTFRGFDHAAMVRRLRPGLPKLEHILVVGAAGEDSFEAVLAGPPGDDRHDAGRLFAELRPDANDVTLLLYTSGTTGEPKGAMHTSNTLISTLAAYVEHLGLGGDDAVFMGAPFAHQIGFTHGVLMPIYLATKSVMLDIWDADAAAGLIHAEGCTFTKGPAPYLFDLTEAVAANAHDVSSLRIMVAGGSPLPRSLVARASEVLGASICTVFGTTENNATTLTRPGDADAKTFGTDGVALDGMEVRVVDDTGTPAASGTEGRLRVRGCGNFVGYLKRPDLYNVDAEGWFETGDLARMDEDGYIRVTGRSKDIIIRGGENIPVVEVENLLYQHPAVKEAAIVAMPDARLGERACGFVTLRPDHSLTFDDMIAFLEERRMARQYLPEHLEVIDEMPLTPSGKIQKFKLREMAAALP